MDMRVLLEIYEKPFRGFSTSGMAISFESQKLPDLHLEKF